MDNKEFQKLVLKQLADLQTEMSKANNRLGNIERDVEKLRADVKKLRNEMDVVKEMSGISKANKSGQVSGRRGSWSQVFYGLEN